MSDWQLELILIHFRALGQLVEKQHCQIPFLQLVCWAKQQDWMHLVCYQGLLLGWGIWEKSYHNYFWWLYGFIGLLSYSVQPNPFLQKEKRITNHLGKSTFLNRQTWMLTRIPFQIHCFDSQMEGQDRKVGREVFLSELKMYAWKNV